MDVDKLLFDKYYRSLCYFAWQMVQDGSLAEDLAQDAFVSYFQHKLTVSEEEPAIKAYLYSSIKFAVYNLNRKNNTVKKFWERNTYKESDDIDYEHHIIRAEFMSAIHTVLAKLPDACRNIMSMSYVEGLSNAEIADQLQLSMNTIKTQKKRGLQVLREKLHPDYFLVLIAVFLYDF